MDEWAVTCIVLDTEGCVVMPETAFARRPFEIRQAVSPRFLVGLMVDDTDPSMPLTIRTATALYERTRGDGVLIYRRNEA
jgi:hypothetical protein